MENLEAILAGQAVQATTAPTEPNETVAENEETKDEIETEESSTSQEAPKPKGVQKRIDELTRDKHEARRFAEQQMEINKQLIAQLQNLQQPKQPEQPQAPQQNAPPEQSQYQTYEDYVMALSEWKAEQTVARQIEAYQKQQIEAVTQRQQAYDAEVQAKTFMEKATQATAKYPDFIEVVSNPQLPLPQSVIKYMNETENTADVAYFLGKNPDLALAIAQKSSDAQEIIIKQLSVNMRAQAKATQAPDPINPIGQGQSGTNDLSKMPMEDFFKVRNQQEFKPPNNRR